MTAPSSLLRSSAVYFLANVSSAAVPFLLLPVLTRALDAASFGRVVNFLMLTSLCGATAGLSLHSLLGVRWFKREEADFSVVIPTCLLLVFISTSITIAVVTTVVSVTGIDLALSSGWVATAAAVAGLNTVINMRSVLWQSQGRPTRAAIMQVTNSILAVSLSVAGVVWLGLGAEGRLGGAAIASLLTATVAFALLVGSEGTGKMRAPSASEAKRALRFSLPLVPHTIAGVLIATADRWTLGTMLGPAAIGVYGAAAQLGMLMIVLGDAFVKSYGPWMYERLNRGEERDRHAVVGASWLSIPVFLVVAGVLGLFLQVFGHIILGERFRSGLELAWWFMLGGAFNAMYLAVAGFFFFTSRTEYVSMITGISAIFGIGLAVWLVSMLGLSGAGMAYALTQGTTFVLALVCAIRLSAQLPWWEVRKTVAVALRELR